MTEPVEWDADQCARHAGCKVSTWRGMVARNQAPQPLPYRRRTDGRRIWDETEVREWQASRPGRGARTDLRPRTT
jgi:predicted DNA-binding transcriptional regulator AlpA